MTLWQCLFVKHHFNSLCDGQCHPKQSSHYESLFARK